MTHTFPTPEAPRLRGGIAAGRIEIETTDTDETVVEVEALRGDAENVRVEQRGGDVIVEGRKRFGFAREEEYHVRIRAPHGARVDLNLASADLRVEGRVASLDLNTASGDLQADIVEADAKVRSASGDVRIESVGGRADLTTASGDLVVRSIRGGGTIRTASGDVVVGEAADRVTVQTASGDLVIEAVAEGAIDVKSASGDVRVGIRQGSRLHVDARSLAGDTSSEVELDGVETAAGGPLVEVRAATMSGDIRIVRA